MSSEYGKLTLNLPSGQDQEFELGKSIVSLGRAMTNDIVLPDARVSRQHAQVEFVGGVPTLIDLGSSNGTRLNGNPVTKSVIKPGDLITVGSSTLRYEAAPPTAEPEMTVINSEAELDATIAGMTMAMSLNETSMARLAVHTPEKTWEVDFPGEALTIGRQATNDVAIESTKVSRQHARIERRGSDFILRDLNSTNGVWFGAMRVDERTLQDGDTFTIGPAQFVFKNGFSSDHLTLSEAAPMGQGKKKRPVVFVPGMMGSDLWLGNERVWPNVKLLFKNPEVFSLDKNLPLEPRGMVGEIVIIPNLLKQEQYNRLGDYLVEELGYERGNNFLEFAYDWRHDVRLAARRLAETIDSWIVDPPITIIAHSLGTLVSRYYVERLGGKKKIERLILLGGPHSGVPKAATSLLMRADLLPFGMMGERIRQVVSTLETSYQILPVYPAVVDQHGKMINLMEDENWLTEDRRQMLRAARQFRQELGTRSSVPSISIFGYGLKTITRLHVVRDKKGSWGKISYDTDLGGDSTIPESSAVLEGSEIHPVRQYHGALYVDNDVKMRLKVELTR